MRLCVSRCLLGEPCRYDGRSKPLPPGALPADATVIPVCPELAAGLGCPREPIELVGADPAENPQVLGVTSRRDVTDALRRAAESLAERLAADAAGPPVAFILKDRSPSCGLHTPLHDPATGEVVAHVPGVWAATVLRSFPDSPILTEDMPAIVRPPSSNPPVPLAESAPRRRFAFTTPFARILQVARQSLRTAMRSRFAASLAALLALVALALPTLVPGDGSPEGNMRILLAWAPGLATILLGAATLWTGCGALATDMEDGTWAGISSTRASRLQLWLGKWLGLVALDAILLAATLGLCAAQARLRGLPAARLRPYAVVAPDDAEFRVQAEAAARRMLANPSGAPADSTLPTNTDELAKRLLTDLHESPISFSAGNSFRWRFPVDGGRGFRHAESARLRLEIVSPFGTAAQIHGRLTVHAEAPARHAEDPARQNPHAENAEAPARQNPHAESAEGAEFTHTENVEAPARQNPHAESAEGAEFTHTENVEAPARQNPHAEFAEGAEFNAHAENAEAPARQNPHAEFAEGAEFNAHAENAEAAESGRSGIRAIRGESVPSVRDSGAAASVGDPLHPCDPCETIAPEAGAPLAERAIAPEDNREVWLDIPGERLAGVETVLVEFENTGAEGDPAALVDVVEGIRFTVPRGSFAGNLARVWAVQLALLALLAAIGTACGAMFTRPVAVFAATAVAVMGIVSQAGFDEEPAHVHDHGDAKAPSAIAQFHANASRYLMHRIALCTQPVADAAAFDRLGDSVLVETAPVARAIGLDGLALPILAGIVSALVLRRREPQGSP